jgi:hypothetical protein
MKIEIVTNTVIPVEIGELQFSVDLGDESLNKMIVSYPEFQDKINSIPGLTIAEVKEAARLVFDFFLGEGSYEKIYEKYPSILTLKEIMQKLTTSLKEEFENRNIDLFGPNAVGNKTDILIK